MAFFMATLNDNLKADEKAIFIAEAEKVPTE